MGKTTYLIAIIATILIGTYLYITCCSFCGTTVAVEEPINERETVAQNN